jgi:demethoxyubiquinone hydroxylase (CLK1/Coq7/Cat5 family)
VTVVTKFYSVFFTVTPEEILQGNRIVNVVYLFEQLKKICAHNKMFDCKFENLVLEKEVRNGLISKFFLKCAMKFLV